LLKSNNLAFSFIPFCVLFMSFDGANIQQFPDIPAVSAEILALRGWEGEKKRAAIRSPWLSGPPSLWYLLPLKRLK